jgi:hypothetical protein
VVVYEFEKGAGISGIQGLAMSYGVSGMIRGGSGLVRGTPGGAGYGPAADYETTSDRIYSAIYG